MYEVQAPMCYLTFTYSLLLRHSLTNSYLFLGPILGEGMSWIQSLAWRVPGLAKPGV